MGPEGKDTRTYPPIHNDGERRPVVRNGREGHCQKQPESHNAIAAHLPQAVYPMNVARISIG
jgi:hypothetical protein